MSRANQMSGADSRMMLVFGGFSSKPETLTFEESLTFVKKVKNGLVPASGLPRGMNVIHSSHGLDLKLSANLHHFVLQLQLLFRNHADLREELEKFRPPVPTKQATNNIWPWVVVCAVPLVAVSLMPALGNPVLWLVQQTIGEKVAT
ncbi:hypothetical protein PR202_ga23741 [Eleusine coracana subsp. coracana]|uniref:Uncharacterized protein n=1 Tax=Eleusine coracana subsp. coracana TaxID=191504 RepID=A0AAV5D6P8_ELECO|nr:hypothetical protein PR202_ga23741 [Eleusine coracana subsp. coracana]